RRGGGGPPGGDRERAGGAPAETIAASRASETSPAEITGVMERVSSLRFAQLDQSQRAQLSQAGPVPGFITNSPVISAFGASTPGWARGMALESVGPFQQADSPALSWVFIPIPLPQRVNLKYSNQVVAVVTILG